MAADDIKLPTAITNKSDSDVGDYEDINDDRISYTNSSSKCAPVHFEPRHNITLNTTNIKCFTEQQSAASTSASVKHSFTANEFLTKGTQQNKQISSSADVSEHSCISEHGPKLSNSSTKPSLSESCLPGETYEYLDIDDGYDDIDKAANAVRCSSRCDSDLIRAASSLDDDEDYDVIDAIGSGNTDNGQNTSLQLNSKNFLYSSYPAPDNTNQATAHASSSSLQTATSSLNASSMADQSESSAPDTDQTRFTIFLH